MVALSSIFFARSAVVMQVANSYLANNVNAKFSEYQSTVSCLEFDLSYDYDLSVTIEKLCINSAYADITINNAVISWQFSVTELLTDVIDNIEISSMTIVGLKAIEPINANANNSNNQDFKISDTPKRLTALLESLTELSLPMKLQVRHFNYQAFTPYIYR